VVRSNVVRNISYFADTIYQLNVLIYCFQGNFHGTSPNFPYIFSYNGGKRKSQRSHINPLGKTNKYGKETTMELNRTGHENRGQQPPQPQQPPQYDTAMSTGEEVAATIVAGGLHHCAHVVIHRPPQEQLAGKFHPHQKAPKKYRAVIEDSDEEQDKDNNFERRSIGTDTHVGTAYASIREGRPTTGLPNQKETHTNKAEHAAHNSLHPEQPKRKQVPQTHTQSNNNEYNLLQKRWRELAKSKEAHEAEATAVLEALKASLVTRDGVPKSEDTLFEDSQPQAMDRSQPAKKMQAYHPSIAPPRSRETCPHTPRPLSTKVDQPVGRERESLWPGEPPGTEGSQNNNHIQPDFGKQRQTLDENQNEKPLIRFKDKQQSEQSHTKEDLMIPRRACNHPKHQAKTYVGQPINIHQDIISPGTQQKRTRMGGHAEETEDNTRTRIGNPHRIGDWFPTSGKVTIDQVHQQTRKRMVWHPQ
jgi:hypothetical protein